MQRAVRLFGVSLAMLAGLMACEKNQSASTPVLPEKTYVDDVAPILAEHCAGCHLPGQPGAEATGFLVDSYAAVMDESNYGRVVDPGSAKTSSLYNLVASEDHLMVTMPSDRDPLSPEEIETIRVWIDSGAVEK